MDSHNILMLDVEKIVADIDPNSAIDNFAEDFEAVKNSPIAITAEDSVVIRKMITDKLHLAGFQIESHNDGVSC